MQVLMTIVLATVVAVAAGLCAFWSYWLVRIVVSLWGGPSEPRRPDAPSRLRPRRPGPAPHGRQPASAAR